MAASLGILLLVVVMGVTVAINLAGNSKACDLVDTWADENGFRVVAKRQLLMGGSFFWARSKAQRVYRVTLVDGSGRQREADLKCGGFMMGMLTESVSVRWRD